MGGSSPTDGHSPTYNDDILYQNYGEDETDVKPVLLTLQGLNAQLQKTGKTLVPVSEALLPRIRPLQTRKAQGMATNAIEINPVRLGDPNTTEVHTSHESGQNKTDDITETDKDQQQPNDRKTIQVIHEVAVRQITKGDDTYQLPDLTAIYYTQERPNFHIDFDFYKRAFSDTKRIFAKHHPIDKFIDDNFDVKFVSPEAAYYHRTMDDTEVRSEFPLPMSSAHRQKAQDPIITVVQGQLTVHMFIYVCVEVTPQGKTQTQEAIPYRTNKEACDNLINNVKAVALYRRHMHPGSQSCFSH